MASIPDRYPPTIDPAAATRWMRIAPPEPPWLHEEVGSRMEQRLQWIKRSPASWADWDPLRGGNKAHQAICLRYPNAPRFSAGAPAVIRQIPATRPRSRWNPARWLTRAAPVPAPPMPDRGVDLLWANLVLHNSADPQALIASWHKAVAVDGFLMFSCFGPDTLGDLRRIYADLGWPAAGHELTDMHDWGDMLVQAGFAEPVMDMERIDLSFSGPGPLLLELRALGRNLHVARFAGLRSRAWQLRLGKEIDKRLPRDPHTGRLRLGFEIIYGHAFKPQPKLRVASQTSLSMEEMRAALRQGRMLPPGH